MLLETMSSFFWCGSCTLFERNSRTHINWHQLFAHWIPATMRPYPQQALQGLESNSSSDLQACAWTCFNDDVIWNISRSCLANHFLVASCCTAAVDYDFAEESEELGSLHLQKVCELSRIVCMVCTCLHCCVCDPTKQVPLTATSPLGGRSPQQRSPPNPKHQKGYIDVRPLPDPGRRRLFHHNPNASPLTFFFTVWLSDPNLDGSSFLLLVVIASTLVAMAST